MKPINKIICIVLIFLFAVPSLPVGSAAPSSVTVVTPGVDPSAILLGAARYRSFDNTNPPEVYLGIYDLGAGRPFRETANATWSAQNSFAFVYDPANNRLTTTISNTNGTYSAVYPNYFESVRDLKFAGDAAAASRMLGGLNYLQIMVQIKDPAPAVVNLDNVTLDGNNLGSFHGSNELTLSWQANDYDLSQGFTITGTLSLTGPFKKNQEWNKVEIDFGRVDHQGPVTSNLAAAPNPASSGQTVTVTALVDDSATGNSLVASTEYSLDGGQVWQPMLAQDGAYDETSEAVTASFPAPGIHASYNLCVRGNDDSGNAGANACTQLVVSDLEGPLASSVTAAPNPVDFSQPVTVTATVDDTGLGGSLIASAEYTLDAGATWQPMQAQDGTFDAVNEGVIATFTSPATAANYNLCVRGRDDSGNDGAQACTQLNVADHQGPLANTVVAAPNPVSPTQPVTVTATINDTDLGGSLIASAELSLDGGQTWHPMQAQDGAFDEVNESVTVTLAAPGQAGSTYGVCVRGVDAAGNTGTCGFSWLQVGWIMYLPIIHNMSG